MVTAVVLGYKRPMTTDQLDEDFTLKGSLPAFAAFQPIRRLHPAVL